ncbi:uncharacterized protein [Henckelia pumila]|uniref:uncharacterized protein n=1 Tax=Henckelia pumila TaxID=405737 RepID=UPI003C6E0F13
MPDTNEGRNKASVGVVVRNSQGVVLGAMAESIRNPGSVLGAELIAIRSGMDFCIRNGYLNICIFSDSLQAVRSVNNLDENLGVLGSLVMEICSLLISTNFVSLIHMSRNANGVAHLLARMGLSLTSKVVWLEGPFSNLVY